MTEAERRAWAGLCVTVTGLMIAVAHLRQERGVSGNEDGFQDTLEAGKLFTRDVQTLVTAKSNPEGK